MKHIEKWNELISRSSAYDAIREFLEDKPEHDLSRIGAKEIAEAYDRNVEEEVRNFELCNQTKKNIISFVLKMKKLKLKLLR